jgi:hypothetical protein
LSETPNCRVCGDELTDENWYPSFKSRNSTICNKCNVAQRAAYRLKWRIEFRSVVVNKYPFQCRICASELTDSNWRTSDKNQDNRICHKCSARYVRHRYGHAPLSENKECPLYLGVHVAERVLSRVFKDVERMPLNNPGYDFICNKGKKIDVKSSCKRGHNEWVFNISHNLVADYFLLIAFDNRCDLNPLHLWLMPGDKVSHKHSISIRDTKINKWDDHRLDLEKVVACCEEMRS